MPGPLATDFPGLGPWWQTPQSVAELPMMSSPRPLSASAVSRARLRWADDPAVVIATHPTRWGAFVRGVKRGHFDQLPKSM